MQKREKQVSKKKRIFIIAAVAAVILILCAAYIFGKIIRDNNSISYAKNYIAEKYGISEIEPDHIDYYMGAMLGGGPAKTGNYLLGQAEDRVYMHDIENDFVFKVTIDQPTKDDKRSISDDYVRCYCNEQVARAIEDELTIPKELTVTLTADMNIRNEPEILEYYHSFSQKDYIDMLRKLSSVRDGDTIIFKGKAFSAPYGTNGFNSIYLNLWIDGDEQTAKQFKQSVMDTVSGICDTVLLFVINGNSNTIEQHADNYDEAKKQAASITRNTTSKQIKNKFGWQQDVYIEELSEKYDAVISGFGRYYICINYRTGGSSDKYVDEVFICNQSFGTTEKIL